MRFIVVGGLAARVWGSPAITNDLDVCYQRSNDNHEALVRALRELDATLRVARQAGPLDCLGTPAGTKGYADLVEHASEEDLGDGLRVLVASIDDLIRMKRAAARPKDRIAVEILTAVKEERERNS